MFLLSHAEDTKSPTANAAKRLPGTLKTASSLAAAECSAEPRRDASEKHQNNWAGTQASLQLLWCCPWNMERLEWKAAAALSFLPKDYTPVYHLPTWKARQTALVTLSKLDTSCHHPSKCTLVLSHPEGCPGMVLLASTKSCFGPDPHLGSHPGSQNQASAEWAQRQAAHVTQAAGGDTCLKQLKPPK